MVFYNQNTDYRTKGFIEGIEHLILATYAGLEVVERRQGAYAGGERTAGQ
ncbi:hypothetical protein IMPR6_260018 [Imperialibacter sp. EC-SDR9]|nr:hypothetical protein IMPERIA75_320018 [Imperialibacter sp. 75]CAD5292433.1 hypothetical protein IMPERIA89_630054 [Imperialibacter sp. 89]VVT17599.1 hypothetical protein IMPR6_260018 [Imperialibacter sp. EC-SDR9]